MDLKARLELTNRLFSNAKIPSQLRFRTKLQKNDPLPLVRKMSALTQTPL